MTKTGWWSIKFEITLDGKDIGFIDLDEASREHILAYIADGYCQGEIVEETDEE